MGYDTPILFIIFNRPDVTFKVFDRIKEIQPKFLFIAADGPRKNKIGENELCDETRKVIHKIDWSCTVQTLFRDENLGCAKGVSSAISWFFEQVQYGIILEDDCLPDVTFFSFSQSLLLKYKEVKNIGAVCGFNSQLGISRTKDSYYFAKLHSSWGWATWSDRWQFYNIDTEQPREDILNREEIVQWKQEILNAFSDKLDSWAYRWQYVFRRQNYLAIYPNVSLIRNIGFAENASNTTGNRWWYKFIQYGKIENIKHPQAIQICDEADKLTIQLNISLPLSWKDRFKRKWFVFSNKYSKQ